MKRFFIALLVFMLTLTFIGCDTAETDAVSSEESVASESETAEISEEESMEESVDPTLKATKKITTLDYVNKGKMGDVDGPAFCVYSKKGFNGASVVLDIANSEIQTKLPDGKHVNGYIFLGADVFEGAYWINCFDAGLCWSGRSGGWHIFYNIYETVNETTSSWYESSKKLPQNGRYRMTLELIGDELAKLTVEGIDNKFSDSVKIEIKGAKKTGENTGMLFNVALDYPPDTKVDQNGDPTEDWGQITLAHSDKGIYLKNLHATELTLCKNGVAQPWLTKQNSSVGIWPDKQVDGFDYAPTEIYLYDGTEYFIDLDMNRK